LARAGRSAKQFGYQDFTVGLPELHLRQVTFGGENAKGYCEHRSLAYGDTLMLNDETVDILVVEDNDSERASIVESLQASIHDIHVVAVHDGTEALDFLFARGNWTDRVEADSPKLILLDLAQLDLALPGSDGFSVLEQIRSFDARDALTLTPVVIFTDSQATGNITRSYRCGANSYIMKPLSSSDFQAVVKTVGQYWMTHNRTSS
jgi:two-component system response regulator